MVNRLADFGKTDLINPRTGYSHVFNYEFYQTFNHKQGFGSEYTYDFYFFKSKVLGKENIRRLEKLYKKFIKKILQEKKKFENLIGTSDFYTPDLLKKTCRLKTNKLIQLTDEQLDVARMWFSYENRAGLIFACLKFSIETEIISKHGFNIKKKNENNDFLEEEKYIICTINNNNYKFQYKLYHGRHGWIIDFNMVNFEIIKKEF